MNLGGKASRGYAMAALLVAMSVMALGLSVALPAWSFMIRREKEEELIFRGTQYARAINMYQRKYANANPENLDALIKERFLRKKFKDPLSPEEDGEFQFLYPQPTPAGVPGTSSAGGVTRGTSPGRSTSPGGGTGPGRSTGSGTGTDASTASSYGTKPTGGIAGVTSKNTGESIRPLNGKTHYNEWEFLGIEYVRPGGGASGAAGGAGAGERGGPPPGGNRGGPNSGPRGGGPGPSGSGSGFGPGFGPGSPRPGAGSGPVK